MGVTDILKVKLGKRTYPIYLGVNILKEIPALFSGIKTGQKVMIITNPLLARLYGKRLKELLASKTDKEVYLFSLPLEEKNKDLKTVEIIYKELSKNNFERNSSLIALGGGVVGDIVGYVAATYLRGLNYFQVPTTLLAQVDSSVGGKTAVNLPSGKNLAGAFYQPRAVFIDVLTLNTLPHKEWLCGLAEIIKYGVIKDSGIFKMLEKKYTEFPLDQLQKKVCLSDAELQKVIKRSCEIKAKVVSKDEKEGGLRAILNYGHTVGHAIESVTKHKVSHGEAVALGMIAAAYIAESLVLIKPELTQRIKLLIKRHGLQAGIKGLKPSMLIETMKKDKKVKDSQIRFVLPVRLGKVKIFDSVKKSVIEEALIRLAADKK